MSSALADLSVREMVGLTASDAPAPGGGSISALAGSLGAALTEMVAALTIGREKYRASEEDMKKIREEAASIREELLLAVDRDTESFSLYMAALSMPKNTEDEKAARRAAMQEGLKTAARVPLETARAALRLLPLARTAVVSGNENAVTDALVGAMMARSAVLGAVLNCRINLASIRDEDFTAEMGAEADRLVREALAEEQQVFAAASLTADFLKS